MSCEHIVNPNVLRCADAKRFMLKEVFNLK